MKTDKIKLILESLLPKDGSLHTTFTMDLVIMGQFDECIANLNSKINYIISYMQKKVTKL